MWLMNLLEVGMQWKRKGCEFFLLHLIHIFWIKDDWRQPFQHSKKWQLIEGQISEHCLALVWKPGFHLCVDDNKASLSTGHEMKATSLTSSNLVSLDFGFSRNKTPKTFGPVFNLTALLGTRLFVSGAMSCRGDKVKEVNNQMFWRLCQTDVDSQMEFGGSKVPLDQPYNSDLYQVLIKGFGGCTLNTVKSDCNEAFHVYADASGYQLWHCNCPKQCPRFL